MMRPPQNFKIEGDAENFFFGALAPKSSVPQSQEQVYAPSSVQKYVERPHIEENV